MRDYRTGCRNVSHCQQQQSYSGLRSPGRSNSTYFWNDSWVQAFHSFTPIRLLTGIRLCLLNDISEVNERCKVGTNKESFLLWLTWRCNAAINSEVICTWRGLFHVCELSGQWDTRLRMLIMYTCSFALWNQVFHQGGKVSPFMHFSRSDILFWRFFSFTLWGYTSVLLWKFWQTKAQKIIVLFAVCAFLVYCGWMERVHASIDITSYEREYTWTGVVSHDLQFKNHI